MITQADIMVIVNSTVFKNVRSWDFIVSFITLCKLYSPFSPKGEGSPLVKENVLFHAYRFIKLEDC